MGHSLGGYTVLSLCGAVERRPRVRAALLFSPAAYMFSADELRRVDVPVMLMFGELEAMSRAGKRSKATLYDVRRVYTYCPPPKYMLEIRGASHLSFCHVSPLQRGGLVFRRTPDITRVINEYGLAFLQRYVGGDERAQRRLNQSDDALADYQKQLR